jgi:hypothetical protein
MLFIQINPLKEYPLFTFAFINFCDHNIFLLISFYLAILVNTLVSQGFLD